MTSSNGNIFRITGYWPFVWGIHRWPMNSPHKRQWRGVLMFPLICWINVWANNREAGDLRRHRAHCNVSVMDQKAREPESVSRLWCVMMRYDAYIASEPESGSRTYLNLTAQFEWRHNERHGVSVKPAVRLFIQLFVYASIKRSTKARVTGPLWGKPPVTCWFPSQSANSAESVYMAWRYNVDCLEIHWMYVNPKFK